MVGTAVGKRPSDLLEFDGSVTERLFLDAAIIAEYSKVMGPPMSTYDAIMRRRAAKGYPGVYT